MKPLTLPLLSFLVALTASASLHAASFEGRVRMKMTAPGAAAQEIDYRMKDAFVRTEMNAGKGQTAAMIMNLEKQEMIILIPDQKMYMVQAFSGAAAKAANAAAEDDFTFEKTGEKEEILGYECEKYITKSKEGIAEIWATDKLGRFLGFGNANANPMAGFGGRRQASATAAWEKALAGKDFFPLRVISRDPKGKEQVRLETIAVEKAAQPDSLFSPPADFQKLDLGGMMQGFGLPGRR